MGRKAKTKGTAVAVDIEPEVRVPVRFWLWGCCGAAWGTFDNAAGWPLGSRISAVEASLYEPVTIICCR